MTNARVTPPARSVADLAFDRWLHSDTRLTFGEWAARYGLAAPRRAWEFLLAPFVDSYVGISITRLLAIFYALLIWHAVENAHVINNSALTLAIVTLAAAFGKSTFTFFLRRAEFKQSSTQSDATSTTIIDETKRLIDERRVEDGAAPTSMPATGALVPE